MQMETMPLRLRSYQTEMLQASMERNVIVAMDTGSGKTHIAAARIRLEIERSVEALKCVWFLAPSKTLAEQQYRVLCAELSAYGVRLLTGADGCETWSHQRLWDAFLTNVRVVVATPAILLDALDHAFVRMASLALIVFDEAHHCTKKHPMRGIMARFYHPARHRGEPVPHILALTASPVVNSKQAMLHTIEANLNAIAVTPKEHRHDLEQYVNPPEFQTLVYPASVKQPGSLCSTLSTLTQAYDLSSDPYVIELSQRGDEKSRKELSKVSAKKRTYCLDQLRALNTRAGFLLEQLGGEMAEWYILACIERFRAGLVSEIDVLPDLSDKERRHLTRMFDALTSTVSSAPEISKPHMTRKAAELVNILVRHADPSLRGIIFVEQRVLVTALAELLRRLPELKQYRVAAFVGTSTSSHRKVSVADLVAMREQESDLEAFRNGEKNLMIATNVLEEGIDISACNLVICFDPPKNLVSFVQRRGRARQRLSKYILFAPEDELKKSTKPWAALEAEMKKMYMDDSRQTGDFTGDDVSAEDLKSYQVPSTLAMLTLDNAKSHLYHFCSVCISHGAEYIDSRPEFDTTQEASQLWTATVSLPAFVHPDFRTATSAQAWPREDVAIKDAAYEAYVALHKAGLVNDNLLPVSHNDVSESECQRGDQTSLSMVSEQLVPWTQLYPSQSTHATWSRYKVTLKLKDTHILEMYMYIPVIRLDSFETFRLYWNQEHVYTVALDERAEEPHGMGAEEIDLLRQCTRVILHSVHASRTTDDVHDYPVLFAPPGVSDLRQWLSECHGQKSNMTFEPTDPGEIGLVRINGQAGRSFFYHSTVGSGDEKSLVVTSFPKRKDFLHPVVPSINTKAAYTAKVQVPIGECTFDRLPAKYALFAAFVPSVLHRVETTLVANTLQTSLLRDVNICSVCLVLEAISSPSARESSDYNRLEYLGDTVLKHCTELQVIAQHLKKPEAFLTSRRDHIVRNSNLAKAALHIGLDTFILSTPFTGAKWRPPSLSEVSASSVGTRETSSKTLADVAEALIGASYVEGGVEKALSCIKILLPNSRWDSRQLCFETLEASLAPDSAPGLALLEKLVGHKFKHTQLLLEAMTHASFPYNRSGMSYERLEFLGDSVLDMIITPKLFGHPRRLRHWKLHTYHEALVNGHFLAYVSMAHAIEEKQSFIDTTAKGEHKVVSKVRKVGLHDFLRAGAQTMQAKHKAVATFEEHADFIAHELEQGTKYPWTGLVTLAAPKFFSDVVESVLGAIYVDTRGDLAVCEGFVERLGMLRIMQRILDSDVDCLHPKERVGILANQDDVKYVNERVEVAEDGKRWTCTVIVGGDELLKVESALTKDEAEVKAAQQACLMLEGRGRATGGQRKRKVDVAGMEDEVVVHG